MSPPRWREIEDLYHAALDREPGARGALLAKADPELRCEVESLLAQYSSTDVLGRPVEDGAARLTATNSTRTIVIPGIQLGPYKIEGPLGQGGMGEVYRARDTRLGRPVAIKFLLGATAADRASLARFRREAQAISALNHPNVCTIYDIGEQDGRPYLVMELLDGQTLKQRISSGACSHDQILGTMIPILEGLEAAHAAGIVHRDIR
jgi:serine/threonine protein kinase